MCFVFFHVPKTGGTTVSLCLEKLFRKEQIFSKAIRLMIIYWMSYNLIDIAVYLDIFVLTKALEHIAARGIKDWKEASGYYRRSIAENAMYRLKQLFGDRLASRQFETQGTSP